MKTNPVISLAKIFTILLFSGEVIGAEQLKPEQADDPFRLTYYDQRIPADAWMLYSFDMNRFFETKAATRIIFKEVFEGKEGENEAPKPLLDLLTSGKLKLVLPYPFTFGIGGDPTKPGNSIEKNPALVDFLSYRHHFGLYVNLSQVPDAVFASVYRQEVAKGDFQLTRAQEMELVRLIKETFPPSHFGMSFNQSELNFMGSIHDLDMAEKWGGDGLPQSLLNAIPASSLMALGASIDIEEANQDIRLRIGQFLKIASRLDMIDFPKSKGSSELEQMETQLNGMTLELFGMKADDLIEIFHGDLVAGFEMSRPTGLGFVIGATIKDESKLTTLLEILEAKAMIPSPLFQVVRRPGHLFVVTANNKLARQLKRGDLELPITGAARKALEDSHLTFFADIRKMLKVPNANWPDWFDLGEPGLVGMLEQFQSIRSSTRFEEGKVSQEFTIDFVDPKQGPIDFLIKYGGLSGE